jgi:hypothetical protein
LVSNSGSNSIAFGKALRTTNGTNIPTISHNGFGLAITSSNLLAVPAGVVLSATANVASTQNVGGLELDWGRWDDGALDVKSNTTANAASPPGKDLDWAVFKPANMASLSGTFRYGTTSDITITGIDDTGNALKGGLIEFDVNLAGGVDAISNGLLQIFDSRNSTWRATFNGDVQGAFAKMTDISGSYNNTGFLTGAIGGAFIGTGTTPDFLTGFALQNGGLFIQGITVLNNENCFSCAAPPP